MKQLCQVTSSVSSDDHDDHDERRSPNQIPSHSIQNSTSLKKPFYESIFHGCHATMCDSCIADRKMDALVIRKQHILNDKNDKEFLKQSRRNMRSKNRDGRRRRKRDGDAVNGRKKPKYTERFMPLNDKKFMMQEDETTLFDPSPAADVSSYFQQQEIVEKTKRKKNKMWKLPFFGKKSSNAKMKSIKI